MTSENTQTPTPLSEADLPRTEEEIDAALVRLIAETEATVTRLQSELAERRANQAQHAEIERLEHHLAEATVNWAKVRAYFEEVLHDLVARREAPADPQESDDVAHEPNETPNQGGTTA